MRVKEPHSDVEPSGKGWLIYDAYSINTEPNAMMTHGKMTWSSSLVPVIEPQIVSQIVASLCDVALLMSSDGRVLGVMINPDFRCETDITKWEGHALTDVLNVESTPKFEERLGNFLQNDDGVLPVELNHQDMNGAALFPMRYSFHQIGTDGTFLMLGRDLRPIWEIQQQLVSAQIALEKDYEARRENDALFRVLMASSSDAIVFVAAKTGQITDCNGVAAKFLGRSRGDLLDNEFAARLGLPVGHDLINRLVDASSEQSVSPVGVTAPALNADVTIHPTLFRMAGAQMLLCRLQTSSTMTSQYDALADSLSSLYDDGIDGILFASRDGRILSANEAFLSMADVTNAQALRGRNVSEFLARGTVDQNVIFENASRAGSMRMYATRLISEYGSERQIEIATSFLKAGTEAAFALVIRDVSRSTTSRAQAQQSSNVDMSSVVELIGSQSLKDIVAKTTDVVEKMCIETAVEMTSNNRVAAAEMLGLSRQSLYVKLRKYGLLKKDG
ncbi:transcriptional regulator PpsR [Yoonia sp. 208BN28-4]|uniref:transcriptional regulator PpsR n=1 Tax=Yoonia sp. 208BN28-4 TaxID=3126505 RepID=UPI00309623F4